MRLKVCMSRGICMNMNVVKTHFAVIEWLSEPKCHIKHCLINLTGCPGGPVFPGSPLAPHSPLPPLGPLLPGSPLSP